MVIERNLNPQEIWQTLSKREQKVCMDLANSDEPVGLDRDLMLSGPSQFLLDSLIDRGIVFSGLEIYFAREYINNHQEEALKIKKSNSRTVDEDLLLLNLKFCEEVVEKNDVTLITYKLKSPELRTFLLDSFEEAASNL